MSTIYCQATTIESLNNFPLGKDGIFFHLNYILSTLVFQVFMRSTLKWDMLLKT